MPLEQPKMQTRGHASNIDSPPHIGYDVGDCTSSYLPANTGSRCGLGCILAREHVNAQIIERETGLATDHVTTLSAVLTWRSITVALAFVEICTFEVSFFCESVEEGEREPRRTKSEREGMVVQTQRVLLVTRQCLLLVVCPQMVGSYQKLYDYGVFVALFMKLLVSRFFPGPPDSSWGEEKGQNGFQVTVYKLKFCMAQLSFVVSLKWMSGLPGYHERGDSEVFWLRTC